ncbi:acetylglutamate kinase [Gammaproteobacteria bacterium]|nr:acetylglutamate kinase [Gammaproteobacteria bacterium]
MNPKSPMFIKETILKLLGAIGSEKEIKKYVEKYSSPEQRFAIIKVGGSVVQHDLDNLVASLVFLDQVGLKPVIMHGAGPMLSDALNKAGIHFSFIDGQRVTSPEVRDIAQKIFCQTNQQIVEALELQGAKAQSLTSNIFQCIKGKSQLGLVGEICDVNLIPINAALEAGAIPVIAPIGADESELLNINADIATVELVKAMNPYKVIFLSETGGIVDQSNQLIETINLVLEYEELMQQDWLHSGMKLKLTQVKTLLDHLPKTSSVSITQPINLPKELFTDSGSGTLIKQGFQVNRFTEPTKQVQEQFKLIIESSFDGMLADSFFVESGALDVFMTSCGRATIAISNDFNIPYMDKFGVIPEAKGEGLGAGIWYEMRKAYPQVFWRSRANNPINRFYSSISEGCQKHADWHIFWIGITDYSQLKDCIEYALNKPKSVH